MCPRRRMELEVQPWEVKQDPPAGFRGTQPTKQIQNMPERDKSSQGGMFPGLKKCLDVHFFPSPSFAGVSQPGTAFPACQGLSASAFAAKKSLCHLTSSCDRQQRAQRLCSTLYILSLGEAIRIPGETPQSECPLLRPDL